MKYIKQYVFSVFSICRSINLPSLNQAVAKVTEESCCNTRSTSKTTENTPLGTNPPLPMKLNTKPQAVTSTQGQAIDKDLTIILTSEDKKACVPKKPPTSRRSKHMLGPQRQVDYQTLAQMKWENTEEDFNLDSVGSQMVIEDCHVMTDDSSYADWLLKQGIEDTVQLANTNADDTCKSSPEAALDDGTQPPDTQPLTIASGEELCREFVTKFQLDLDLYFDAAANEEEVMKHADQLKNILFLMGQKRPTLPPPPVGKTMSIDPEKCEAEAFKPSTSSVEPGKEMLQKPSEPIHKTPETGGASATKSPEKDDSKSQPKPKTLETEDKNKEPKGGASPTKLPEKDDTNNQPIHKTPESNENNEGTEASVENKETDAKAEEGTEDAVCKEDKTSKVKGKDEHSNYKVSGESKDKETKESKNKKVSFDMNVNMKIDTNSKNLDAQNVIIQTGDGQNNGNNTISSDNTHILDDDLTPSQEIPLSQKPWRNPYVKDDDSNNSASNDLGSENDDNIEDT